MGFQAVYSIHSSCWGLANATIQKATEVLLFVQHQYKNVLAVHICIPEIGGWGSRNDKLA